MISKGLVHIPFIVGIIFMIDRENCDAALRILGGRDAFKDEFPLVVHLEEQRIVDNNGRIEIVYRKFCTGAALTPSWILSAAHCGDDDVLKLLFRQTFTVKPKKFARSNSYFPKELGTLSPIFKVLVYPNFFLSSYSKLPNTMYDIALFQTENLTVSRYGKISAIDYLAFVGHEADVLGFGRTNATPTEKPLQVLRGMLSKCDEAEGQVYGFLCVVSRCDLEATICGGDSGGPVVHASGIVGVNSASWGDCDEFSHALHPGHAAAEVSMVSPCIDWISNIITN